MGRYRGALAGVRPDDLAAHTIRAAVERTGLDPGAIRDVYWGAANQSGEDNRDAGRMASLLAGLPVEVPGVAVNRLCASGLEAVNQASRALRLGEGDLYLAGGAESMSRAPWVVLKPEAGLPRGPQTMHDTALGWRLINPLMAERYSTESMGETAENVAERYGVAGGAGPLRAPEPRPRRGGDSRRSLRRADRRGGGAAARGGATRSRSRSTRGLGPTPRWRSWRSCGRRSARAARVTAGNASTLNDGAACLVMASERAREASSAPSRWRGSSRSASPASTPRTWGSGRSRRSAGRWTPPGTSLDQIDLIEINEAFAAQVLACVGELGIEEERLNVNGGAIALGHPLGCSGARLMTTLVWELRRRGAPLRDRGAVRRRRAGRGDDGREPGGELEAVVATQIASPGDGRPELASVDGAISPTAEATIPLPDDGLYRGDGVFEVIRLYAGRPFALGEHLDRLERSAAAIELPVERDAAGAELDALLAALGDGRRPAADRRHPRRTPDPADRAASRAAARRSRLATVTYSPERDPHRGQVALLRGQHAGDPDRHRRAAPTRPCSCGPTASCSRPPPRRSSGSRRRAAADARRSAPASSSRSPAPQIVEALHVEEGEFGRRGPARRPRGLPGLDRPRGPAGLGDRRSRASRRRGPGPTRRRAGVPAAGARSTQLAAARLATWTSTSPTSSA